MELVGVAAQIVVELLNEVPANLILAWAVGGGRRLLRGVVRHLATLLEINITVCRHDC